MVIGLTICNLKYNLIASLESPKFEKSLAYRTYVMTPTAHISVAKDMGSKLTTSGATNSGVPTKLATIIKRNFFMLEKRCTYII